MFLRRLMWPKRWPEILWLDVFVGATYASWAIVNVYWIPHEYGVNVLHILWTSATLTAPRNPVFPFVWVLTLALFALSLVSFRPLGWLRAFFLAGSTYFILNELCEAPAFLLAHALYPQADAQWAAPVLLTIYVSWTVLGLSSLPLWRVSRWSIMVAVVLVSLWGGWVAVGYPVDIGAVIGSETVQPVNFLFEVALKVVSFLFVASLVIAGSDSLSMPRRAAEPVLSTPEGSTIDPLRT